MAQNPLSASIVQPRFRRHKGLIRAKPERFSQFRPKGDHPPNEVAAQPEARTTEFGTTLTRVAPYQKLFFGVPSCVKKSLALGAKSQEVSLRLRNSRAYAGFWKRKTSETMLSSLSQASAPVSLTIQSSRIPSQHRVLAPSGR